MRERRKVAIVKVLADRGMGSWAAKLYFSLNFIYTQCNTFKLKNYTWISLQPFGALIFNLNTPNAITISRGLSHPTLEVKILIKSLPDCHCHLQRAVTPNWMGSIAPWEPITAFFWREEKPSEDLNSRLFLMKKKGLIKSLLLSLLLWNRVCQRNKCHKIFPSVTGTVRNTVDCPTFDLKPDCPFL
jgi:hypothetical protein